MTAVLSKSFPGYQKFVAIPPKQAAGSLPSPIQEDTELEDESVVELEAAVPVAPKATKKTIKSPQVIDLDLGGDEPLAEFLKKYTGDEISKRYLLITYWLKEFAQVEQVNMDHIHTCFRHMNWNTPKDAMQPLRDLKSKSQWLNKAETTGFYTINHIGENEVRKILNGAT